MRPREIVSFDGYDAASSWSHHETVMVQEPKFFCEDLLTCEILDCDQIFRLGEDLPDPDGLHISSATDFPQDAFPSAPRQATAKADQVGSGNGLPQPKTSKPAKKARRQSFPVGVTEAARSLGMSYELTNWDIMCGRGRGESVFGFDAVACPTNDPLPLTF